MPLYLCLASPSRDRIPALAPATRNSGCSGASGSGAIGARAGQARRYGPNFGCYPHEYPASDMPPAQYALLRGIACWAHNQVLVEQQVERRVYPPYCA